MKLRCMHFVVPFLLSIAIIMCTQVVSAQETFAEMDVPSAVVAKFKSFALGDSIFISYDEKLKGTVTWVPRAFWINPKGVISSVNSIDLEDKRVVAIGSFENKPCFYYVTGGKSKLKLKALEQDNGRFTSLAGEYEINGSVLGLDFVDGELYVVAYDNSRNRGNTLTVTRLRKMEVIKEMKLVIPDDIGISYKESSGVFFLSDRLAALEQGAARFKIYKYNNAITFSIDLPVYLGMESKTIIIRLSIDSDEVTMWRIPAAERKNFRSYFYNGKLYRATISKKRFKFQIFDVYTQKELLNTFMQRQRFLKKEHVYFRSGKERRVSRAETVYNMMSTANYCEPIMLIDGGDDSLRYDVVFGTFIDVKGGGVGASPDPLTSVVTLMVTTAIRQSLEESSATGRHLFIPSDSFESHNFLAKRKDIKKPTRQVIDDYEIEWKKKERGLNLKRKAYLYTPNVVYGLYLDSFLGKLSIIRFPN
jgi:hypothetical protein